MGTLNIKFEFVPFNFVYVGVEVYNLYIDLCYKNVKEKFFRLCVQIK